MMLGREAIVLAFQRVLTEQSRTIRSSLKSLTGLAIELLSVQDFVELSDMLGYAATA